MIFLFSLFALATSFLTFICPSQPGKPARLGAHFVVVAWFALSIPRVGPGIDAYTAPVLAAIYCLSNSDLPLVIKCMLAGLAGLAGSGDRVVVGCAATVLLTSRPSLDAAWEFFLYGVATLLLGTMPLDACAFIVVVGRNGKKLYMDARRERWMRG